MVKRTMEVAGQGTQSTVIFGRHYPGLVFKFTTPIYSFLESAGCVNVRQRTITDLARLKDYFDDRFILPTQVRFAPGFKCVASQEKVEGLCRLDSSTLSPENHWQLESIADSNRRMVQATGWALDCFGGFNLPSIWSNMFMDKECWQLHNLGVDREGNIKISDILSLNTRFTHNPLQNADALLYQSSHRVTLGVIGSRTGTQWF